MVGGWLFVTHGKDAQDIAIYPTNVWILAYLAFGSSYWAASHLSLRSHREVTGQVHALVLVVCSIGVSYYSETGLGGVLLMVASSLLPWTMSARAAAVWVLIGSMAIATALACPPIGMPPKMAAIQFLVYAAFSAIMLAGSWAAMEQTSAREAQARLSNELLATRNLLEQSTLISERTRISRDVHDLLGHHLTALILNLDVASRLADGKAREHLGQSHALAKLLLADVRDVVSRLREHGPIDLCEATRQMLLERHPNLALVIGSTVAASLDGDGSVRVLWCLNEVVSVAVARLHVTDMRIALLSEGDSVDILVSSDSGTVASLLSGGHMQAVQNLIHEHGGAIREDATSGAGGLLLKLKRPVSLPGVLVSM